MEEMPGATPRPQRRCLSPNPQAPRGLRGLLGCLPDPQDVGKAPEHMNESIRSNSPLGRHNMAYAVILTLLPPPSTLASLWRALAAPLEYLLSTPLPGRYWFDQQGRGSSWGLGSTGHAAAGTPPVPTNPVHCPTGLPPHQAAGALQASCCPPPPTSRKHSGRMIDFAGRAATRGERGRQGSLLHLLVAVSQSQVPVGRAGGIPQLLWGDREGPTGLPQ